MRIDGRHIADLTPRSFACAVRHLLYAEAALQGVPPTSVHVTSNVDVPDGGIDGRVEAPSTIDTKWLRPGLQVWQFKAGKFALGAATPAILRKILQEERVAEAMNAGAHFVLALSAQHGDRRAEAEATLKAEASKLKYASNRVTLLDADDLAAWASEHPATWYHFNMEIDGSIPFDTWSGTRDFQRPFVSDERRDELRLELRNGLLDRDGPQVFCVAGISGIGKTRFVHDALNVEALRLRSLYARSPDRAAGLVSCIQRDNRLSAILVVDECDTREVQNLAKDVAVCGGRLRLITIYGPMPRHKALPLDPSEYRTLEIGSLSPKKMDELLMRVAPGAIPEQRRYVAALADGVPRIAVLFGMTLEKNPDFKVSTEVRGDVIASWAEKLVPDQQAQRVLEAISLVTKIGWDEALEEEGRQWTEACGAGAWEDARRIGRQLEDIGLIRPQGRYRYVWPHPLAIALAARVWQDQKTSLVKRARKLESEEFFQRFVERLRDLSDDPLVQKAVEGLLASTQEFTEIDLLDDPDTAHTFALLAESHPDAGLNALEQVFKGQKEEKLKLFGHSHKEILGLLDRIARRRRYFRRAERVLLQLAEADAPVWAKPERDVAVLFLVEATRRSRAVFRQRYSRFGAPHTWADLFAIRGAPTAVPAADRLAVLSGVLADPLPQRRGLGVLALRDALGPGYYIQREEQLGSSPPEHQWAPSDDEVRDLSEKALKLLAGMVRDQNADVRVFAARTLLYVAPIQSRRGLLEVVAEVLERDVPSVLTREEIGTGIESMMDFMGGSLMAPQLERLEGLRRVVEEPNVPDRIRRWVGGPRQGDLTLRCGTTIPRYQREASKLADDLMMGGGAALAPHWDWLLSVEATAPGPFARRIGELDKASQLLEPLLRRDEVSTTGAEFVANYLIGRTVELGQPWLDELLTRWESVQQHIVVTLRATTLQPSSEDRAQRLLRLTARPDVPPERVVRVGLADWMSGLAEATVSALAARLVASDAAEARQTGLELIARRIDQDPSYCTRDPIVREVALREEFVAERTPRGAAWQMVGRVAASHWPAELMNVLMKTVAPYNIGLADIQRPVIKAACAANPSAVWSEVIDGLRGPRGQIVYEYLQQWLILELPPDFLLGWAHAKPIGDRQLLAMMTPLPNDENPLVAKSPPSTPLSEVARRLLIEFPEDDAVRGILAKKVLTARNSIIDPFLSIVVGPESERYIKQAERAECWAQDPALEVHAWASAVLAQLRAREASTHTQEVEQASPRRS